MYLGLDLGTSGIKALLVKENNAIIGSAEIRFKISHPQKGWSEQNPKDWEFALKKTVKILKSKYSFEFSLLRGIGISGQMHGATLLDHKGKILRPCILWNDTRSHKECYEFENQQFDVRSISGNIAFCIILAVLIRQMVLEHLGWILIKEYGLVICYIAAVCV